MTTKTINQTVTWPDMIDQFFSENTSGVMHPGVTLVLKARGEVTLAACNRMRPTSSIYICLRSTSRSEFRLQTRHLNCISGFRAVGMGRNVGCKWEAWRDTPLHGNGMTGGALTQGQHHVHHSTRRWAWQERHRTFQQVVWAMIRIIHTTLLKALCYCLFLPLK